MCIINIAHFPRNAALKEFRKSVNIWHKDIATSRRLTFCGPPCIILCGGFELHRVFGSR